MIMTFTNNALYLCTINTAIAYVCPTPKNACTNINRSKWVWQQPRGGFNRTPSTPPLHTGLQFHTLSFNYLFAWVKFKGRGQGEPGNEATREPPKLLANIVLYVNSGY